MSLVQNFIASTSLPNQIALNWDQPLGFNSSTDEIVVTKTVTHFPMELFNSNFPDDATDPRGVEIFRGSTITGLNPLTITVIGSTLTDTSANFPLNLAGRLLRDTNSSVFKIISNTTTSVTVQGIPASGIYVILADFPNSIQQQQNFEPDSRTTASSGLISNLVQLVNGSLQIALFTPDQLVNLIFVDGSNQKFIIKGNDSTNVQLFGTNTPVIGNGMKILNSYFNSSLQPYIDNFKNSQEANNRVGTGLLDDTFYYYTAFDIPVGVDVAQAEFGLYGTSVSTQSAAISTKNLDFGTILYKYWPILYQQLDTTGDLLDLMQIFGFQFNELHSEIKTYNLQDPDTVFVNAILPLSEQFGLPSVGYSIGADTLRRIGREMLGAWKLKGSKEGIARFIRILTTWDVTDGTGDFSGSISDFLPNIQALRFFSSFLGNTNTRITKSLPFTAGGRFVKSLPGIIIPGFFTFREFVVNLPDVALYIGTTQNFTVSGNTTTMTDSSANFGANNSLVDNFLLPNQQEVNDIFQIISNTSNSITVQGIINDKNPGGTYAVLSPLNTNRFIILNKLLPVYIPFNTQAGFNFVN
jgi:hypothetical protein